MSWEVWGDPEDPVDPLDAVEFPRERKPWKRDREAVRSAMQTRLNERRRANPAIVDARGNAYGTHDHAERFAELNRLHYAISRYRMGVYTSCRPPRPSQRFEELARLHRIAELIPYLDKAPLP